MDSQVSIHVAGSHTADLQNVVISMGSWGGGSSPRLSKIYLLTTGINNPLRQEEKDVTFKGAKKGTERNSFVYLFIWEDVYIMTFKMGTTTNCS